MPVTSEVHEARHGVETTCRAERRNAARGMRDHSTEVPS
jgi:hypothetical protein